jgi:antitoxin CptB
MLPAEAVVELKKLRWACRRGMRELDIWLGTFLETRYDALTDTEKTAFVRLLGCQDQELFDWLMGKAQPVEHEFHALISAIQAASRPVPDAIATGAALVNRGKH